MGIIIANTMLDKLGKSGVLKPDAFGYRWQNLGAFGVANESGVFYDGESGAYQTTNGYILRRKLEKGNLCGEADHPDVDGMSLEQAITRMADIKTKFKSHNIKDLRLIRGKYRCPKTGRDGIVVEGYIKPLDNNLGDKLEKDFQDQFQNTSFSIRCFLDENRTTYNFRVISEIITWDWVTEPGIAVANKWQSAACENFIPMGLKELQMLEATSDDMQNAIDEICTQGGTESTNEVLALLNHVNKTSRVNAPLFLR